MELTLWRWSVSAQLVSLAIITTFFAILARSVDQRALRTWLAGWAMNVAALVVTLVYWFVSASEAEEVSRGIAFALRLLYMTSKSLCVLLLVDGGWALARPGAERVGRGAFVVGGLVFPLAAALASNSLAVVGIMQQSFVGLLFVPTGLAILRTRERGSGWLAAGFIVRGALGLVEAVAYGIQASPGAVSPGLAGGLSVFLSVASSFDGAADWLLALGFVLALSLRAESRLTLTIRELHVTQEDLRRLVDRDPLTALLNRRGLPAALRAAQPSGATLLFFDFDDFKRLNDEHGHAKGDECLRRFAAALSESFRPEDTLVRYGGDEFLVIAAGLDRKLAEERVAALRRRLETAGRGGPEIRFSVGAAELAPGGLPDEAVQAALRAADDAMYAAKRNPRPA
jgi:diguanylate cyclase (GGDEF)-like protein